MFLSFSSSSFIRCIVLKSDGVFSGLEFRTELWDKYFTAAPAQRRQYGALSKRKRRYSAFIIRIRLSYTNTRRPFCLPITTPNASRRCAGSLRMNSSVPSGNRTQLSLTETRPTSPWDYTPSRSFVPPFWGGQQQPCQCRQQPAQQCTTPRKARHVSAYLAKPIIQRRSRGRFRCGWLIILGIRVGR